MTDRPLTGRILLIRHGQAMVDSADYDRLSQLGRRQTELLGGALRRRGVLPAVFVDGGMSRQAETSAAMAAQAGWDRLPGRDQGWAEFDYRGVLAGHRPDYADRAARMADLARHPDPAAAFLVVFRAAVARWMSGTHDDDYAEPYPLFADRVRGALSRAAAELASVPGTPGGGPAVGVVVTSAGPIATLACDLLHGRSATWVQINTALANCGVSEVVIDRTEMALRTLNDHAHLEIGDPSLLTYR